MLTKKRVVATFLFLFVLTIAHQTFAVEMQKHTVELGPEISHITYREPGIMREKGFMYGIGGAYTYHNEIMLRAEGKFSYGQVDYSSSDGGRINNIDDYMIEIRGLGGYDFKLSELSFLTPYIGIGYRYLNDDSSGKFNELGGVRYLGYERESNYIYSPIGLRFFTNLKEGWTFGATAEYDYFWWGKQISHLSDAIAGLNDPKNTQKSGYGLRGSVDFQKKYKTIEVGIEPFIKYWNIKESKHTNATYSGVIIGTGWEPKNNSTEIGLKLFARF